MLIDEMIKYISEYITSRKGLSMTTNFTVTELTMTITTILGEIFIETSSQVSGGWIMGSCTYPAEEYFKNGYQHSNMDGSTELHRVAKVVTVRRTVTSP